ncbi:MAG: hypothetical protein DMG13_13255 [Acidobacteria bacterium]|nr:MAG: hypothetical protein DMG13_13255 [Acidobacteriota bacterium]
MGVVFFQSQLDFIQSQLDPIQLSVNFLRLRLICGSAPRREQTEHAGQPDQYGCRGDYDAGFSYFPNLTFHDLLGESNAFGVILRPIGGEFNRPKVFDTLEHK